MKQQTTEKKLRLEQVNFAAKLKTQLRGWGYPILRDISFDVLPGERIAIVGASGAGKSSLLRLINRLYEPTSGKIYLENQEYHQIPVMQLRQMVTLVLQDSKLLGMTVQQALAYPLVLRGLSGDAIQQRVDEYRQKLHIPREWLSRNELELSTGERQLVAIARGLVIQPKLLLLDEPTSALDAGTASHVIQVLTQINQNQPITILMVNNQLDMAERFASRVIYLRQGELFINQSASHTDWTELRATLIKAQTQAAEEWI